MYFKNAWNKKPFIKGLKNSKDMWDVLNFAQKIIQFNTFGKIKPDRRIN